MNEKSLIKSRIATHIVNHMLQEGDYIVIPYGSDDILDHLIQAGIDKENGTSKMLLNMPTFIIIGKNKKPMLLKVKFRGKGKSGRNIKWGYEQINKYWPDTLMMIVTNEKPCFYLAVKDKVVPIDKSVLAINKKTSDKFARLVEEFLLH